MTEPVWLHQTVVLALHERLIADYGGAPGIRDAHLLDAALARPRQRFAYNDPDLFELAASYTAGLIQNHPFVDGNKRVGLMAGYVFLARNGYDLTATEADTAQTVLALAAGEVDEKVFAEWLRRNVVPRSDHTDSA